ncbi:hypothetical protein E4U55_002722 [Claviceps digitariae]|nr:hypothetical protein E4U55_002722 [Claviceps digitariae]
MAPSCPATFVQDPGAREDELVLCPLPLSSIANKGLEGDLEAIEYLRVDRPTK